ncbi:MAG TPA: hypothetical protein VER04_24855 [Polyangiaceae bacterium]|nr:hypothetical protein [Polyangiaceae bacterium]
MTERTVGAGGFTSGLCSAELAGDALAGALTGATETPRGASAESASAGAAFSVGRWLALLAVSTKETALAWVA